MWNNMDTDTPLFSTKCSCHPERSASVAEGSIYYGNSPNKQFIIINRAYIYI
jgi:hypothetical protein